MIEEHYAWGAEKEDKTDSRSHPGFWKRNRRWIIGVLIICLIGAIIGGVVAGTRHNQSEAHNPPSVSDSTGTLSTSASSPSSSTETTSTPKSVTFSAVYKQSDPGGGIGGYDLLSSDDRSFAFDYDRSGRLDHIALYRPGTGTFWILKNDNGTFSPVYQQGDPGNGIGGYDLKSAADRAFAFDYDHSGKLDHIVVYRPGKGAIFILKNENGNFSPVYLQADPGQGIGGYDFASPSDRAFAFDNDHSGKLDHIAIYRPGTGTFWILKNDNGTFSPVYQQGDPGNGIGGYDLKSPADSAFAFDYSNKGKMDYVTLYRPGHGTIWILKHDGNDFIPIYREGDPGVGIAGFDLASPADLAFSFDYRSIGRQDHLVLCRPGTGIFWIIENSKGTFYPVYGKDDPGLGIAGYDLKSPNDLGYAFDYAQSGKLDHLVLYRPGAGAVYIIKGS